MGEKAAILFEFKVWELPKVKIHNGPPLNVEEQYKREFLRKYRDRGIYPYIENDRWKVKVDREFTNAKVFLKHLFDTINPPKYIKLALENGFHIYSNNRLISNYKNFTADIQEFITISILKQPPWKW